MDEIAQESEASLSNGDPAQFVEGSTEGEVTAETGPTPGLAQALGDPNPQPGLAEVLTDAQALANDKPAVNVDVTKDEAAPKEATPFPYEETILDLVRRLGKLEGDMRSLKDTLARRLNVRC